MKREQIRDYKAGQQITTGRINQLVRAARRDVVGETPIQVHSVGNSIQITHAPHKWDWFPARIQAQSSDFSDQRYWTRPVRVSNSDGDYSDVLTWEDAGTVPSDLDVVAENLVGSDSQRLRTDEVVIVFRQEDDSSPTNYRHFMSVTKQAQEFVARISASSDQGNDRYSYSFDEVEKTGFGYGNWTTRSDGRTGTAYNLIEDMNTASGVQGNGVDRDNLGTSDYTFTIQPAPSDVLVEIREVEYSDTTEYWFQYENGVDGTCD